MDINVIIRLDNDYVARNNVFYVIALFDEKLCTCHEHKAI